MGLSGTGPVTPSPIRWGPPRPSSRCDPGRVEGMGRSSTASKYSIFDPAATGGRVVPLSTGPLVKWPVVDRPVLDLPVEDRPLLRLTGAGVPTIEQAARSSRPRWSHRGRRRRGRTVRSALVRVATASSRAEVSKSAEARRLSQSWYWGQAWSRHPGKPAAEGVGVSSAESAASVAPQVRCHRARRGRNYGPARRVGSDEDGPRTWPGREAGRPAGRPACPWCPGRGDSGRPSVRMSAAGGTPQPHLRGSIVERGVTPPRSYLRTVSTGGAYSAAPRRVHRTSGGGSSRADAGVLSR